jgi:mutator protein MutT
MDTFCSVFLDPPIDFNDKVVASGCYCEFKDYILILRRNPNKALGNAWGVPAGKLDEGETPHRAIAREVNEEIGLSIQEDEFEALGVVYVRRSGADVILHLFRKVFLTLPLIKLKEEEHSQSRWVTINEALQLSQSTGAIKALEFYKSRMGNRETFTLG